jgi:hypothetical protein
VSFQSRAVAVTQPESTIPDVRPAEARSRKRDKPEGVTHGFQVSLYKIEPYASAAACNLLSSDDCRLALFDEMEESGPKVPLVSKPFSFACRAERLARARSGPYRKIVGPTGAAQGEGVDADSCEEVALSKSSKFIWDNIFNAPFVNDAGRDLASGYQFAQPCSGERVDFIVIGGRHSPLPQNSANRLHRHAKHMSEQPFGGVLPSGMSGADNPALIVAQVGDRAGWGAGDGHAALSPALTSRSKSARAANTPRPASRSAIFTRHSSGTLRCRHLRRASGFTPKASASLSTSAHVMRSFAMAD